MQFTSPAQQSGLESAQVNEKLFKSERTKETNSGAGCLQRRRPADACCGASATNTSFCALD